MKIEADRTMATMTAMGTPIEPEELSLNPKNMARAAREFGPRCEALPEEKRACVALAVPVMAAFLETHGACDDKPCRKTAGEVAKSKITDECLEVLRDLSWVHIVSSKLE